MNNYPPGSENDPAAPWNEKEPTQIECDECNGEGFIDPEDYDEIMTENTCQTCNGSGTVLSDEEDDEDFDDFELG